MSRRAERGMRPSRFGGPFVRTWAFVRKELGELVRQPRMLGLLVVGPFMLLVLFGAGYSQSDLVLRAMFVGPEGSIYEDVLASYEDDLDDFIESKGFVTSELVATTALYDGVVDVVVVFPEDPIETVLSGERAEIRVIHDEIDPLQQTAIWVATKMAVQEVNANVLSALAGEAQEQLAPAGEMVEALATLADDLEAAESASGAGEVVGQVERDLADLASVLDGSAVVLGRFETLETELDDLDEARTALRELRSGLPVGDAASVDGASVAADLREFAVRFADVTTLDPEVLTRPFDSVTENILPIRVGPDDYFAPSSVALLLQHLAVTFAALSLVRDRSTGLFELLRISPLSPWEIVGGKCLAFLLMGGAVAATLLAAAILLLGVPMAGAVGWLAAMVALVLLASLALGMVLSMLSGTESQAVQYAMLSLLAGLFFSGFVLSIDDLVPPVRVVSFVLPVTYGIRGLQDVMFRGVAPDLVDIGGLIGLSVVYGSAAVLALRAKLRIA